MKISWGTAIVIVFIIFGALLSWAVIESFKADHHLVTEDYYEEELSYGNRMEELENINNLGDDFSFTERSADFKIQLPKNWDKKSLKKGVIKFYKPDNQSLDKAFKLNLDQLNSQIISKESFKDGKWKVILHFTKDGKGYHFEESFFL